MAKAAENGEDLQTSNINRASEEDKPTKLQDLVAQATLKYSVKDYDAAAELYAYATELQAEINGEMSPENADLLYAYGRCLYHVAVKNSDVLGSKVAGEAKDEGTKATAKREQKAFKQETQIQGDDAGNADGLKGTSAVPEDSKPEESSGKPFFQFTGDENFDTSEDEEGGEEDGEEGGGVEEKDTDEEEDDFVVAFEVLDLARLLLQKKIEETEASQGKGKEFGESTGVRQLKERLADTYDLQAEISLEGERFPSAVIDLKSSLELKKALYPQESSLIAEAHFKLSLALEFSSVTQQKDENGEVRPGTEAQVDEAMREEAASELEAAISSCNLRISKEESRLKEPALTQENGEDGKRKATKDEINEVKEMVKDLQQRLVEIRQPPVSINDSNAMPILDGSDPLSGILGSVLGQSPAAQKAKIEEASKSANDLTNLVKRKKQSTPAPSAENATAQSIQGNGKRKADFDDAQEDSGAEKKVKSSN